MARSHRFEFIPIRFSSGKGRVVIGPDHGPRVDVEQARGTARAWLARRFGFIRIHVSSGKGRVVIGPDHSPHVDVEQWQVHVLCSNLALAVMGRVHILRVQCSVHIVIMMNTAQRHCHSKCHCA